MAWEQLLNNKNVLNVMLPSVYSIKSITIIGA